MKCDKKIMLLYAVTDRFWTGDKSLYEQVEEALIGGVSCLQLREKELEHDDFLNEAFEIKKLCKAYNVPFIINDNVTVAMECSSDGIHVGQHDMRVCDVRSIVGENMLLGVSVQTVSEALDAQKNGADYLGVGAVFKTSTKSDADSVSYETLKKICSAVDIPVVAIGGITKDNILSLCNSGIDGVALVSAIFSSSDIQNECRKLKKLAQKTVEK